MKRMMKTAWLLAALGAGMTACADDPVAEEISGEPEDLDPTGAGDGKFEAWNAANNPAHVDSTFLYYVHQLPLSGQGKTPIPGDYWAISKDNLNHKWDGSTSMSPAEKYAKAFGKAKVPENISTYHGVKAQMERKTCSTNTDCTSLMDGSVCASSKDGTATTVKRCIPTWWGICHGWAPYALSEAAPKNPVVRTAADGTRVTFYPGDIEGLMSLLYTDVPTKFLSSRCDKDKPPTDAAGRLINGECRDMNAGSWHVLVTNMMGLRSKGFVLDQTFDDEVWNQPAWKFTITNATNGALKEVSKEQAIQLLGSAASMTSLLGTTDLAASATKSGSHTATAAGEHTVRMTGTGDADLYVRKGSAPTTSTYDCRPYTETSDEDCVVTLASGEKLYWMVSGYATTSKVQLGVSVPGGAGGTYSYNTLAKKFYHVEMDFTFIVESSPARTSHIDDVAQYAETKHYSYLLEADGYNKVIGGEWLGSSRTNHPDFAWWPTSKPTESQAGGLITYAEMKALSDESAGPQSDAAKVTLIDNATMAPSTSGRSLYRTFEAPAGTKRVKFDMTGSGDADLYIGAGFSPTVYNATCKSVTAGTSSETCTLTVPSAGKTYTVRARTKAGATITVTAEKLAQ